MDSPIDSRIIKEGDHAGNRMIARYTLPNGIVIDAIGVPQAWNSPLGPTWCYVVEGDKLTLVDTGAHDTYQYLEEGLKELGRRPQDVGRIVISHGHMDHDGNCYALASHSGAQVWAHEVYKSLVGVHRHGAAREVNRRYEKVRPHADEHWAQRVQRYEEDSFHLEVTHPVVDGLNDDGMTFYYMPGHSPDELVVRYENVLFSGDHVLPLITPHPSMTMDYGGFREHMPGHYHAGNRYFGLKVYLQSLKRVPTLGEDLVILPAHRAFYRYKFNPIFTARAIEILDHHVERCYEILELLKVSPMEPVALTRKYFPHIKRNSRHFYIAFTEALAHLELLEEAGDLVCLDDGSGRWEWTGTVNFDDIIKNTPVLEAGLDSGTV